VIEGAFLLVFSKNSLAEPRSEHFSKCDAGKISCRRAGRLMRVSGNDGARQYYRDDSESESQRIYPILNSACMVLQNSVQDLLLSDQDPHHDRIERARENKMLDGH
jgi:hypothetical protein